MKDPDHGERLFCSRSSLTLRVSKWGFLVKANLSVYIKKTTFFKIYWNIE